MTVSPGAFLQALLHYSLGHASARDTCVRTIDCAPRTCASEHCPRRAGPAAPDSGDYRVCVGIIGAFSKGLSGVSSAQKTPIIPLPMLQPAEPAAQHGLVFGPASWCEHPPARDRHSAGTPSLSLLRRLLTGEGGGAE